MCVCSSIACGVFISKETITILQDHKEGSTWEVREKKKTSEQKGPVDSSEDSAADE